jgi:hypothetical protein
MSARVDDLLRDLHVELENVAPSAGFRQRVRAHAIARGRVRRGRVALPAVLATAAAVFLTARSVTPVPDSVPVQQATQVLTSRSSVAAAHVAPTPAAPGRPRQAAVVVSRVSTSTSAQPEVLVPADQEIALRQWLNALRAVREPQVAIESSALVPPIVPIEISPIQIDPVFPGQTGGERNR